MKNIKYKRKKYNEICFSFLFFALDPQRNLIKLFLSFTTTVNHFPSISLITTIPLFLTLPTKSQNESFFFLFTNKTTNLSLDSQVDVEAHATFFEDATRTKSRLHTALNNVPSYWNLVLGGKHNNDRITHEK